MKILNVLQNHFENQNKVICENYPLSCFFHKIVSNDLFVFLCLKNLLRILKMTFLVFTIKWKKFKIVECNFWSIFFTQKCSYIQKTKIQLCETYTFST